MRERDRDTITLDGERHLRRGAGSLDLWRVNEEARAKDFAVLHLRVYVFVWESVARSEHPMRKRAQVSGIWRTMFRVFFSIVGFSLALADVQEDNVSRNGNYSRGETSLIFQLSEEL